MKNFISFVFGGFVLLCGADALQGEVFQFQRTINNPGIITGFGVSLAAFGDNLLIGNIYGDIYQANTGTAYLYDIRTGEQLRKFVNPAPQAGDLFGRAVGVVGNTVLVGAPGTTTKPGGAVFMYDGTSGQFLRSVTNPAGAMNDRFGWKLESIGNNAVVGAPELRTGTQYNGAGRVYVVNSTSGGVVQSIVNPQGGAEDSFGYDLAPYGNDILVGALYDDNGGKVWQINSQDGSVVRTYNNPDGSLGNGNRPQFGVAVDVLGDYLLVGANQSSASGVNATGAAYLFDLKTGNLLHRFFDPVPGVLDNFGISVALVDDYAVIGAHNDDDGGKNGSAFIFDLHSGSCVQTIKSPASSSHFFGLELERVGNNMLAISDTTVSGNVHIYAVPEPSLLVLSLSGIAMFGIAGIFAMRTKDEHGVCRDLDSVTCSTQSPGCG